MSNFRLLLVRFQIHRLLLPFSNLLLKAGNFIRLSSWISQNRNLAYNDYYSGKGSYYDRYKLYQHIVDNEIKETAINYLEFGVGDGETMKWWAKNLTNKHNLFYGFDTFQGIPEAWGVYEKGAFSQHGKKPSNYNG